jgi:hypothetical protein
MPLLFSYGSLQQEDVQRSTFGRLLDGQHDELVGFELSSVPVEDPEVAARIGRTHHANLIPTGVDGRGVRGMVFEVTDDEIVRVDGYEAEFSYERIEARLASGRRAWVYVAGWELATHSR